MEAVADVGKVVGVRGEVFGVVGCEVGVGGKEDGEFGAEGVGERLGFCWGGGEGVDWLVVSI